jgi:hypothetical protein
MCWETYLRNKGILPRPALVVRRVVIMVVHVSPVLLIKMLAWQTSSTGPLLVSSHPTSPRSHVGYLGSRARGGRLEIGMILAAPLPPVREWAVDGWPERARRSTSQRVDAARARPLCRTKEDLT